MRRYSVPRVVFVNKLDRVGANPWRVISQARDKLKLNAAAVQVRAWRDTQGTHALVNTLALLFPVDTSCAAFCVLSRSSVHTHTPRPDSHTLPVTERPCIPCAVLCCVCGQVPIGLEEFHEGVVDIVGRRALRFGGAKGLDMSEGPVPPELSEEVEARRAELVERVSEVRGGGG